MQPPWDHPILSVIHLTNNKWTNLKTNKDNTATQEQNSTMVTIQTNSAMKPLRQEGNLTLGTSASWGLGKVSRISTVWMDYLDFSLRKTDCQGRHATCWQKVKAASSVSKWLTSDTFAMNLFINHRKGVKGRPNIIDMLFGQQLHQEATALLSRKSPVYSPQILVRQGTGQGGR